MGNAPGGDENECFKFFQRVYLSFRWEMLREGTKTLIARSRLKYVLIEFRWGMPREGTKTQVS